MNIDGQPAIVTGGASGLGKATAEMLAARGARVAIMDLNAEAAEKVAAETGGPAVACDVTDAAAVEAALKTVVDAIGAPRICINAAGVGGAILTVGKEGPHPLEDFARIVNINLIGTFNVLRLVAAGMTALEPLDTTERGVIVNVSSVAAFDGQRGQAAYAASKGGVASMLLPIARDLARHGIRVTAIAPGIFHTPLLDTLPENVQKSLADSIPFPQRLGKPAEFAALAIHMVENPMLNGELVRLDGAVRLA